MVRHGNQLDDSQTGLSSIFVKDTTSNEGAVTQYKMNLTSDNKKIIGKSLMLVAILASIMFAYLFVNVPKSSNESRISYLETIVKCPTCISVSTKDANTASAFALRNYITEMVRRNVPNSQVIAQLIAIYGQSIVLVPQPKYGGTILIVSGVAIAVFMPLSGVIYYRKKRRPKKSNFVTQDYKSGILEPNDALGVKLVSDLAASALQSPVVSNDSVDNHVREKTTSKINWRSLTLGQKLLGITGSGFIIAGVILLIWGYQPSPTSQVVSKVPIAQAIGMGQKLAGTGNDVGALSQFGSVLAHDPTNSVALAWNGWLLRQAGQKAHSLSLIAAGTSQMKQSVELNGSNYYARLFLGISLFQDDRNVLGALAAVTQFNRYFALSPPNSLTSKVINTIAAAYQSANVAMPHLKATN